MQYIHSINSKYITIIDNIYIYPKHILGEFASIYRRIWWFPKKWHASLISVGISKIVYNNNIICSVPDSQIIRIYVYIYVYSVFIIYIYYVISHISYIYIHISYHIHQLTNFDAKYEPHLGHGKRTSITPSSARHLRRVVRVKPILLTDHWRAAWFAWWGIQCCQKSNPWQVVGDFAQS